MSGNLYEWCSDDYGNSSLNKPKGLVGRISDYSWGSWLDGACYCLLRIEITTIHLVGIIVLVYVSSVTLVYLIHLNIIIKYLTNNGGNNQRNSKQMALKGGSMMGIDNEMLRRMNNHA